MLKRQNFTAVRSLVQSVHMQASSAPPDRMIAWLSKDLSGLSNVHRVSVRLPPLLKPTDMLIKVRAASVNPLDVAIVGGYGKEIFSAMRLMDRARLGQTECSKVEFQSLSAGRDFCGEVVNIGHEVHRVGIGDVVCGVISPQGQGSHAEYVVASESNVVHLPTSVSEVIGAAYPYAGLTAYSAIVVSGAMRPNNCRGVHAIVLGASGGVGSLATQLLTAWGADVTAVCSTNATEMVSSCGASSIHDYKDSEAIQFLLSQSSYDLIVDASGQPDVRWLGALKKWSGASYVTLSPPLLKNVDDYGWGRGIGMSFLDVLGRNAISLRDGRAFKWAFYMPNSWALRYMADMIQKQKLRPVIDKVFSFDNALEAYNHMLLGPSRGKTVIRMVEDVPGDDTSRSIEVNS